LQEFYADLAIQQQKWHEWQLSRPGSVPRRAGRPDDMAAVHGASPLNWKPGATAPAAFSAGNKSAIAAAARIQALSSTMFDFAQTALTPDR